jgi:phytoene synthase
METQKITKKYGTSYYLATLFFPKDIREATWTLYAFFRIPDEIVDTEESKPERARERLIAWQKDWETEQPEHPVLQETKKVFARYSIPTSYATDFIQAMISDTSVSTYKNYDALKAYMYGSAAVVGLMMSYVIGYEAPALEHATELGYAMQLTNFLRDIDEDYTLRGRIYLPQEDFVKFGIDESYFKEKKYDENWKNLIKFEIERTRKLYRASDAGMPLLSKRGRFAVILASSLYEKILDKIEQANYNIWNKRVRTTRWDKVKSIIQSIIKKYTL